MNIEWFYEHGFEPVGVIHVGAHEGQEVPMYQEHGLNIVCFEPLDEAVEIFRREHPGVKLYKVALGNKNRQTNLNVSNDGAFGQSSSLLGFLPENIGMTGGLKRIQKTTEVRFDNLAKKKIKLDKFDTVIIDVQGAELNVLRGMKKSLSNFKYFIIECSEKPIYRGGATAEEVVAYMIEHGFKAQTLIKTHDDIVFVREDLA